MTTSPMPPPQRTLIMGILNLTPDSFSDGGRHSSTETVLAQSERMLTEGADLIDIGGESTRPGADPVSPEEEQRRILPVLEELFLNRGLPVSLDTRHAATARAALQLAGDRASELIINDVSGLLTDEQMPQVIVQAGCPIIITHNRGDAQTMQSKTDYADVVSEVIDELLQIRGWYVDAGVEPEQIILDPGIGFAKTHEQNWELIRNLGRFTELEHDGVRHRMLFGASRKGFLNTLLTDAEGSPRPAEERDTATAVLSGQAAQHGAWAVRVHAVRPNADAVAVAQAIRAGF